MPEGSKVRRLLTVRGLVQGVGFRPFVYRVAKEIGLRGTVENSPQGVLIDVEGTAEDIQSLVTALKNDLPAPGHVQGLEEQDRVWRGFESFEIVKSSGGGETEALILPDIATCSKCLGEVFDPENRRYRYPFTNCTHCGPRFTIIQALPYDRGSTTMKKFKMCTHCQEEYDNPMDRRFHAQPNACPTCGPEIRFFKSDGRVIGERDDALGKALETLNTGKILAIKGLGGFHLMVDATNEEAIQSLRLKKLREEKALALMVPDLAWAEEISKLSEKEKNLLTSPQAPITLVKKKDGTLPEAIAPGNALLGLMLPYTPLHHILLRDFDKPVVATSGNRKDEPICFDENEVLERLGDVADGFLIHDRPIERYVDDSIARVVAGRPMMMRRARGYAPLPVGHLDGIPDGTFGFGAHLKSTVAFSKGGTIFLSHHIGDLETQAAVHGFDRILEDFPKLYHVKPKAVVRDKHPDYYSSQKAKDMGLPNSELQHHVAHVMSGIVENELSEEVLAFSWDGTGLGDDGQIWGSEIFTYANKEITRIGSLEPFKLIGGDRASKEPRRSALGLLYPIFGDELLQKTYIPTINAFERKELETLLQLFEKNQTGLWTTSMGRLFDGVASLLGLRHKMTYEAQAAIALEQLALKEDTEENYSFKMEFREDGVTRIQWHTMLLDLITDMQTKTPLFKIARKFHNTLAECVVEIAKLHAQKDVLLTGGCFQNQVLTETTLSRLEKAKYKGHMHQKIPPNDAGIAVGQVASVALLGKK